MEVVKQTEDLNYLGKIKRWKQTAKRENGRLVGIYNSFVRVDLMILRVTFISAKMNLILRRDSQPRTFINLLKNLDCSLGTASIYVLKRLNRTILDRLTHH